MKTNEWFKICKPNPTPEQACIQIGVHLEEVAEMLYALGEYYEWRIMADLADEYKERHQHLVDGIERINRVELLDSIIDQNVTGKGICHTLGLNFDGALEEVERSNASKLEDGKPVFDENGKIAKGKNYVKPNLKPFV
ncbi:NTP pyrophosphohydrolase-like domain [Vibrio phage 1.168.O._10N.261.52.A10]|nr:NTP pyrophosphohydrolase-like domain [Vibrio phage 1.168.O._10N.261.52.A10]